MYVVAIDYFEERHVFVFYHFKVRHVFHAQKAMAYKSDMCVSVTMLA